MSQKVTGIGKISAKLTSQTGVNNQAYSGIMLRSSSASGSAFISISRKTTTDSLIINYRDPDIQQSKTETISGTGNWFKIKKEDANIDVLISEDGTTWNAVFSIALELSTDFLAGFYTTSHNESNFCTATFENTNVDFRLVGIENVSSEAIRIYPNPAFNRLFVQMEDESDAFSYKLTDIAGKVYLSGHLNEITSELDIRSLPFNQYYILQVFDDNKYIQGGKIFKK